MAVVRKYKTDARNRYERRKKRCKGNAASRDLPVLIIRKSNQHIAASLTSPAGAETIVSLSTQSKALEGKVSKGVKRKETAQILGAAIGAAILEKGIKQVAFNRNGYIYHGVVAAFAQAVRDAGVTI